MGKKFLSFLGTTDYKKCCYKCGDYEDSSKFIQKALIDMLCKEWCKDDTAVIFITDTAEKLNWSNASDETRRLKQELMDSKIGVKSVSIPECKNEDEIWEMFDILLDQIDENDEIIFDMTHSFRSIPMLALVVLNYAKVLKNIKIKGIYYGAYEARKIEDGIEKAPVFDMTPLNEMLEWSQAVNSFLSYGNSSQLKNLCSGVLLNKLREKDKMAIEINNFIKMLYDFTNDIYTCRGLYKDEKGWNKKSAGCAYKSMKEDLKIIKKSNNTLVRPLIPLFEKIDERTSEFEKGDNFKAGMAMVKWSIDNNFTQQAYTGFDETLKTYICLKYGLDETDRECREEIAAKALRIKSQDKKEDEWDVKEENRAIIKKIVSEMDDELKKITNRVTQRRNDINHFGFNDSPGEYDKLNKDIRELYEEFKEYTMKNYNA